MTFNLVRDIAQAVDKFWDAIVGFVLPSSVWDLPYIDHDGPFDVRP